MSFGGPFDHRDDDEGGDAMQMDDAEMGEPQRPRRPPADEHPALARARERGQEQLRKTGLIREPELYREKLRRKLEAHYEKARGDERVKRSAEVRRGYNLNTVNRGLRVYGLLTRMEGRDTGPWWLRFECFDAQWMDAIRQERAYVKDTQRVSVEDALRQFLGGRSFHEAWTAAGPAERHLHASIYEWFFDRFNEDSPLTGIFECVVHRMRHVYVPAVGAIDAWYQLGLVARDDAQDAANGMFIEANDDESAPVIAVAQDLARLEPVFEPLRSVLLALHHPNFAPPPQPPPALGLPLPVPAPDADADAMMLDAGESDGEQSDGELLDAGDDDEDPFPRIALSPVLKAGAWIARQVGRWAGYAIQRACSVRDHLLDMLDALSGPAFALAPAGAPLHVLPRPRESLAVPQLSAYIGDHRPNPMCTVAANRPGFVGVVDVGQGNLNMVVGAGWRVQAYYDYGYTTDHADGPGSIAARCFCHRPVMVLSHWDIDHYGGALKESAYDVLTLQWIVPEQQTGPQANRLMSRIKKAGGQVCVWKNQPGPSHMRFPWGFLTRCNGGGTNGSGIAAFVCVRDDPLTPYVGPGVAIVDGIDGSSAAAEVGRGRAAVAQVVALGLNPPVAQIASSVAAALAASNYGQTIAQAGGVAWAQVCANLAAQAGGFALAGGDVDAVHFQITPLPPTPLPGLSAARDEAARGAVARAAVDVCAVAGLNPAAPERARHQAAGQAFKDVFGGVHKDVRELYEQVVMSAHRGHAVTPTLLQGDAPFVDGEKYVLLNGDANFEYVPPMTLNPPPEVVALTAMHHGSMLEDGELLHVHRIPWAPGSLAARAAQDAGDVDNVVDQATSATVPVNDDDYATIRLATLRAAAAAAGAILVTAPAGSAACGKVLVDLQTAVKIAAAAAAAVIAAHRYGDARCAGLAAALCATYETNLAPIGSVVDAAQGLLSMARPGGGGVTVARVRGNGLFHTRDDGDIIAAVRASSQLFMTPDNTHLAVREAGTGNGLVAEAATYLPILAEVAAWAVSGFVGTADADEGSVLQRTSAAQRLPSGPHGLYAATGAPAIGDISASIDDVARLAARFAAEGVAARRGGLPDEVVAAAIRAVVTGTVGNAVFHANSDAGQIAYSYGVTPDGKYRYKADTLGGTGHAHPAATRMYEARGWTRRFNTSANAHQGPQADGVSPRGHVALCWDPHQNSAPPGHYNSSPNAQLNYVCPDCGLAIDFNY